ncbi:MAG: META domain-containing protein [Vicinamibacterales bacterium]
MPPLVLALSLLAAISQQPAQLPPPPAQTDPAALTSGRWRLTHLGDAPVEVSDLPREPHLVFEAGGGLGGADGCNTLRAQVTVTGESLSVREPILGTLMACHLPGDLDRRFRDALRRAASWTLVGTELSIADEAGGVLARFERVLR